MSSQYGPRDAGLALSGNSACPFGQPATNTSHHDSPSRTAGEQRSRPIRTRKYESNQLSNNCYNEIVVVMMPALSVYLPIGETAAYQYRRRLMIRRLYNKSLIDAAQIIHLSV